MIREADKDDAAVLANLAVLLWDSSSAAELSEEFSQTLSHEDTRFFLKYEDTAPVGFSQCSLRHDYVEGTDTSPVGYLEGIFVKEEFRHKGYAKELLAECEKWAKAKGCTEFASDCELSNNESLRFHEHTGFSEAGRIICFTKKL